MLDGNASRCSLRMGFDDEVVAVVDLLALLAVNGAVETRMPTRGMLPLQTAAPTAFMPSAGPTSPPAFSSGLGGAGAFMPVNPAAAAQQQQPASPAPTAPPPEPTGPPANVSIANVDTSNVRSAH